MKWGYKVVDKWTMYAYLNSERTEDNAASSSDEEEEEDFTSLRSGETKMEVDQDGKCGVSCTVYISLANSISLPFLVHWL